ITDAKTNEPLIGVTIYLPDLKTGAVTDVNGHFKVGHLPSGNFTVSISFLGYKTISEQIPIKGTTHRNFQMNTSTIEQNEVVVTGLSKATQINRSPIPIIAVNHQYITQNLHTNIIDAISNVPGVSALTTGPNVSKPFIHGLGYNRVLTLYDGMRQEEQQWGDEHGIGVDGYSIDHVEVIEGPASLSYGSDALAGVINLIPTPPAPDGKIIGNVMGEYQTNNGLIGGSAMLSGNRNGFYWLGRLSHKSAKNYRDKIDGWVFGTNYEENDATVNLGINRGWGYSHWDLTLFDDLQAIPDGSRDSVSRKFTMQTNDLDTGIRPIVPENLLNSYTLPVLHQHVQLYRIYSSNSFIIGQSNLNLNLGFERSLRREYDYPEQATIPGLFLQLNTYTYDAKYFFPEIGGWNITAGFNGMYQVNTSTAGTDFLIPNYHQFDLGPFVMAKKSFGKLDLAGGVRYDFRFFNNNGLYAITDPKTGMAQPVYGVDTVSADHIFSDYKHMFSGFSGNFGATYNFNSKMSVKFDLARGYRAPNIAEISSNGVHPGTNIYQIGNPGFSPEFDLQEDLGFSYNTDRLSVNLDLFNNNISNYIYNQKVLNYQGQDSVIVPGNETFKFQQTGAQLYGGSISVDVHPLKWLHFGNSLSTVYGVNKGKKGEVVSDSAKYLPLIMPLHTLTELRAEMWKRHGRFANGFAKIQMEVYGAQNRAFLAYNTETPTAGYVLFNAGIGTDITDAKGKTLFNISLLANNIFNTAYQSNMSRLKYMEEYPNDPRGHLGIYNMGRNVGLRISVPLDLR
ncbi:MAG: TonB-dependent receptor, partial [Chitinophagaceae bacterium]